jgi:hypothetical protein
VYYCFHSFLFAFRAIGWGVGGVHFLSVRAWRAGVWGGYAALAVGSFYTSQFCEDILVVWKYMWCDVGGLATGCSIVNIMYRRRGCMGMCGCLCIVRAV